MIMSIKNELLEMAVDSYGAELVSLKTVRDGMEFLWQKDARYWNRQAPILFPIVGSLPDNRYQLGNTIYEMKRHGFARQCEFTPVKSGSSELIFQLVHSEETLRQYSFQFEFLIKYKLEVNRLCQSFCVNNPDQKPLLFSVGAHPGFRCPLYEDEKMEDYYLLFEKPECLHSLIEREELLTGETKAFLEGEREKRLSDSLFAYGVVILREIVSKWLEIRSRGNDRVIRVEFGEFPYLGIWSKNQAPFVCIEPWHGIGSTKSKGNDFDTFDTKEGILKVMPGESFECGFSITVD